MPAASQGMTEAAIVKWVKNEGDSFSPGDVLLEVETDKAVMQVEAHEQGVIDRIVIPEGTNNVKVNAVIALLAGDGEPGSSVAAPSGAAEAQSRRAGRIFASPLARRMAKDLDLDIAAVAGSGPSGRVLKADVQAAARARPATPPVPAAFVPAAFVPAASVPAASVSAVSVPAASVPAGRDPTSTSGAYEDVPHTNTRRVIAQRLSEAKQTIPHFYLTVDCQVDELLAARRQANEQVEGLQLSVNDFVVRAAALALRKFPEVNASWAEAALRRYRDVDVAVAVATPGGLLTPVVRNADAKSLGRISSEVRELADRARQGKLRPEEFQGGSLTVSNLGMHGIREFAAIINPPQSCILAVGVAEQRPVVRGGTLAVATLMTCTLSADHRVVDGVLGAEFLAAFRKLLEAPFTLLV